MMIFQRWDQKVYKQIVEVMLKQNIKKLTNNLDN